MAINENVKRKKMMKKCAIESTGVHTAIVHDT